MIHSLETDDRLSITNILERPKFKKNNGGVKSWISINSRIILPKVLYFYNDYGITSHRNIETELHTLTQTKTDIVNIINYAVFMHLTENIMKIKPNPLYFDNMIRIRR